MKLLTPKKDQKVVAAFPTRSDRSGRFMDSFVAMQAYDFGHGQRICDGGGVIPLPSTIIAAGRNQIVRTFLEDHTADWLWFIDDDMTFEPDILDRMVESAHPRDRPIMGALCFSITDDFKAVPTIYVRRPDGGVGRVPDYPRNAVIKGLTGTGCILLHRSVLERMGEAYEAPWQWFSYGQLGTEIIGEDITFCLLAQEAGFPIHINTSIKCGHVKPIVVDEAMFIGQAS